MSTNKKTTVPILETEIVKTDLRKKEPPLINLQVSNPVTYLKRWWKRVIGGEGVDFRFKIQPFTAIAMTIVIATIGFGVGRISITTTKPYIQLVTNAAPQTTSNQVSQITQATPALVDQDSWRETAFSGMLKHSIFDNRYYLITNSSEAITLDVPENVVLESLIGRRIFATGRYNDKTRVLAVLNASDLEILPETIEEVPIVDDQIENEPLDLDAQQEN